ncbi:MAG TPA: hypothetical protein VKX16_08460 [Chloroflexota bacterium]|nr:hypothetical protein [Chloroflexota bacterium]
MSSPADRPVLLFYRDYERDKFFPNDRYIRRYLRPVYNRFRRTKSISGFHVWYLRLVQALRESGYQVEENNFGLARRYPDYPVGLVGYPSILRQWDLPNPAILGPGLFDHPAQRPDLMNDKRYRYYIVTCDWVRDMFQRSYGACCVPWYAGIDTREWPDATSCEKTIDLLVYDKIRWNREAYERDFIMPLLRTVESSGRSYSVLRYGEYQYPRFRELLRASRAMIFLCEHETQGMAYQEAMACNVPILAWDNGYWLDPRRPRFDPNPVPASSVPYFSAECGERFRDIGEFPAVFDRFWTNVTTSDGPVYRPRQYVERELSLAGSARLYMQYYDALLRDREPAAP